MGEKNDLLRIHARLLKNVAKNLHHAFCDPARIGMRGQHRKTAHHLVGRVVDEHGLGKGPADIDADAVGAGRQ